jgi:hypothetical protein
MNPIDKAIEALEMATQFENKGTWTNVITLDARKALDEALKALRDMQESGDVIKIKRLQWRVKKNGTKFCTTSVGHYEVGEDGFMYSPFVCKFPTYSEAIRACEKDYFDKVEACLSVIRKEEE